MCKCNGRVFWETSPLSFRLPHNPFLSYNFRETRQTLTVEAKMTMQRRSRLIHLFLALAVAFSLGAAVRAEAPQDIWLVSTRDAAHCGRLDETLDTLGCWRLTDSCEWSPADAADCSGDCSTPTVVFVHGNRTDADDAVAKGWCVRDAIRSAACGRAFRFVIWSWPADRIGRRHRPDAQLKADYSDDESYYLAAWLHTVPPATKVSLIGHSFGSKIILGALRLLAGGEVTCRRLPKEAVAQWTCCKRNPIRAMLLGAAVDSDALAACEECGSPLSLLERVFVTCNGCDRALRWYPRLYGRGGSKALGAVGPCGVESPAIDLADVSGTVGRKHDCRYYCDAPEVRCRWLHYAFLDDEHEPNRATDIENRREID